MAERGGLVDDPEAAQVVGVFSDGADDLDHVVHV
jgi:hypothetical protein